MDKTLLHEMITDMYTRTKEGNMSRLDRIEEITALADAYFDAVGEHPETKALERMANLVLYEELSDPHADKMTRDEYPFLSESQFDERYKKEASDKLAEEYDQNGSFQGRPIRRTRSMYENKLLDRKAKARNKERRKRYSAFITGKSNGQFTVNIATGEKVFH
ncbi:hypothetical protein [Bacillus atrophaeus]|uniref:hypothetical protein n=1 Tax=Bacillus atrophaeus TaxID=1452 RepID=UPI001C63AC33|nr:hypothetical protein [Bacillus atrophaeus]QYG88328.1 hypothetical protein HCU65_07490 [Bacillus atrophaeus]